LPLRRSPASKTYPSPARTIIRPLMEADYSIRFYLEHGVPPLAAPGTYQLTSQGYRP